MPSATGTDPIISCVEKTWGYSTLRPLQREAIDAGLAKRDSLVVMPTGGGKSLCYQVPPLISGRLSIVVSPLIALMQDQVDGLKLAGVPAAALNSSISAEDSIEIRRAVAENRLRLLLVAPERLLTPEFMSWLKRSARPHLDSFAIDEAHCISQWGHDFRPEYRRLAELRGHFPDLPLHAYTATATPRVREDIVDQLSLRDPAILVGRFDRPNLTYRVLPRVRLVDQVAEVLKRHEDRAAIVYCLSRRNTEELAESLKAHGIIAKAYHAGMTAQQRTRVQDAFINERLNVVTATVAFGMGIDRSDVRCVIHATMPKTVEHYQQETGRAGRDGLPSECVLFYSSSDVQKWKQLMQRSIEESEAEVPPEVIAAQHELLGHMQRLCTGARCRHKALSEYFGQAYEPPDASGNCGGCDVCLKELADVDGATDIARKILSCVARVNQSYGAAHVADVLVGKKTARIVEKSHHLLSTHALLADHPKESVLSYINQLIDDGVLERDEGEYPVLRLNAASKEVMRNERSVSLVEPRQVGRPTRRAAALAGDAPPLSPEEVELFESLRGLRRDIAGELNVPPYVVFSDATLEEMARVRPGSKESFVCIKGIGQTKLRQFGERFVDHIRSYCARIGMQLDAVRGSSPRSITEREPRRVNGIPPDAARLFAQETPIDAVAARLGRSRNTTADYLVEWVRDTKPASIDCWVDPETQRAIIAARNELGDGPLRPLYERLEKKISYEEIKVTLTHRRSSPSPV